MALCIGSLQNYIGPEYAQNGGTVQLLGGGALEGTALVQQGQEEKKELEQMLIEKRGFGEANPSVFFIG